MKHAFRNNVVPVRDVLTVLKLFKENERTEGMRRTRRVVAYEVLKRQQDKVGD